MNSNRPWQCINLHCRGFFSFGIRREPDIGCEAAGLDLISMIAPTSHAPLDSVFQHRRRLKKWQLYRMVLLWAVPLFVCVRNTDRRVCTQHESGCAAKRLKAVTECHRPTLRQLSINRQFSIAGQDLTFQVVNSMIFKQASKCETPGCTGSSS